MLAAHAYLPTYLQHLELVSLLPFSPAGGLIDYDAVSKALFTGRVGGLGLDVHPEVRAWPFCCGVYERPATHFRLTASRRAACGRRWRAEWGCAGGGMSGVFQPVLLPACPTLPRSLWTPTTGWRTTPGEST